ncbi:hypothetical protein, partial [Mycobacteroides abscessus]|uniref:hypothetical protein n=1 Tax=Mycobacteroides abscessus TaxID=36809 RepID=UPI001C26119A
MDPQRAQIQLAYGVIEMCCAETHLECPWAAPARPRHRDAPTNRTGPVASADVTARATVSRFAAL